MRELRDASGGFVVDEDDRGAMTLRAFTVEQARRAGIGYWAAPEREHPLIPRVVRRDGGIYLELEWRRGRDDQPHNDVGGTYIFLITER
jgi:hypothetical protein